MPFPLSVRGTLLGKLFESELHGEISSYDAGDSTRENACDNASEHVLDVHRLPPQASRWTMRRGGAVTARYHGLCQRTHRRLANLRLTVKRMFQRNSFRNS